MQHPIQRVAIQGYEGSFHQEAVRIFFGEKANVLACARFQDVVKSAADPSLCDAAVMAIENDIMHLKRNVADKFMAEGIYKFILIGENVLNFHSGDKDYYEEWLEDVNDQHGWIVCINMPEQTQYDFRRARLNQYIELMEQPDWRIYKPFHLFKLVNAREEKRLNF
ncbi:MAG TPA: prephenate dehydratase domain-containing protein [Puia sp.]|nr:prephenate dehydratase domain-containing protein [Puia sp.]